jgi:hypothetical protein
MIADSAVMMIRVSCVKDGGGIGGKREECMEEPRTFCVKAEDCKCK